MSLIEETIDATLSSNGELHLTRQPQVAPGPVNVTIRAGGSHGPSRSLSDVVREIAAEQRARGFTGRSKSEILAEDDARMAEDAERDRELDQARGATSTRGS